MNKKEETKEKTCAFYASDYHFEMMSLPYISKKIEENKDVIILTENNLEETINTVVSKINLENNKKENILKINWKENHLEKFKKIKENTEKNKDTIIFIKGRENYIKNINENIEKWIENSNRVKVIDCYDMNEIEGNLEEVAAQYKNVLSTKGEKQI